MVSQSPKQEIILSFNYQFLDKITNICTEKVAEFEALHASRNYPENADLNTKEITGL